MSGKRHKKELCPHPGDHGYAKPLGDPEKLLQVVP